MKNENSVMAILAAAVGALCSYAAALVVPLAVLLAVMVGDYVSGMAKAWSAGELCSRTGVKGIVKKVGYLMVVGAAGAADWLIRYGLAQAGIEVQFSFLIAAMVIIWLIGRCLPVGGADGCARPRAGAPRQIGGSRPARPRSGSAPRG